MNKPRFGAAVVLCLPLIAGAPAFAATALSTEDFVRKTAISDMFEIETGKLAADKAKNAEVKSFGERMVTDHTKTSEELTNIVEKNDIKAELPKELDAEHKSKLDSLEDLSGAEFDRAYMPEQVKAHQQAVKMFEDYASAGEDAQLKQWAQKTLPALQKHLQHAQSLNDQLGKAPAMAGGGEERQPTDRVADAESKGDRTAESAGTINYVVRQQPTDWTAQALIGRQVKNPKGEELGEINNIILNERGDVVAVTIGVGGFLGIGEKNVGVPFNALQFKTEEALDRAKERTENGNVAVEDRTRDGDAEEAREARNESAEETREARYDSQHEDMEIVLNATREQLEKAPDFVWLDEQDDRAG